MTPPAHIDEAPPVRENPEDSNEDTADLNFRQAPHNIEVEQALLGALLVNNNVADKVTGFLKPEHFFEEVHARIYDAITRLIEKGQSADPVKLKPYFEKDEALEGVGGAAYLVRLAASAATIISAQDYGVTIYELALRRELIGIGEDMVLTAYDAPIDQSPSDQIENVEQALHELGARGEWGIRVKSFDDAGREALDAVEAAHVRDGPPGLTTGLLDLDRRIGGLFKTDLVIIAGRPGHLKSTVATNIARGAAQSLIDPRSSNLDPKPIGRGLIFSLEMSAEQLGLRMVCDLARLQGHAITYNRARLGKLSQEERSTLYQCWELYRSLPLSVVDKASMSLARITGMTRRLKRTWENAGTPLGFVIIDYLQLIAQPRGMSKIDHVSACSRGLKVLAKDLDLPVIALSQLSREVEKRDNKRPMLSDLRESGSIEQDADMVIFCYREYEYLKNQKPKKGTTAHDNWLIEMEAANVAFELIIGKQRHGPTGKVDLAAFAGTASIRDKAQGDMLDG